MSDLKEEDDRDKPDAVEVAMIVLSVAVTLGLFGYVGYHAFTGPTGPELTTETERIVRAGDTTEVHLLVRNEGGTGVSSVTVEVPCDDPPSELEFLYLPADGQRRGVIICPADAEALTPEISTWTKV